MTNPLHTDGFRNFALLLGRATLGTYFLLAGFSKWAGGVRNFVQKVKGPAYLPKELTDAYLFMLPTAELVVGVALVIGFFTRTAATLMALMLTSFIIAMPPHLGFQGESPNNINKNLIFLALALILMSSGGGTISVDQSMGGGGGAPGPKKK